MAKKTHIDVKVSVESIRDSLRKRIVSENSALITNVIIGNLEKSEVGLEQLYKALSGVQDKMQFKVGDRVVAPMRNSIPGILIKMLRKKQIWYSREDESSSSRGQIHSWSLPISYSLKQCKQDLSR